MAYVVRIHLSYLINFFLVKVIDLLVSNIHISYVRDFDWTYVANQHYLRALRLWKLVLAF